MNPMVFDGRYFDEDRALYNLKFADLIDCKFEGEMDGRYPLKEAEDVRLVSCHFSLRYPLWNVSTFSMEQVSMNRSADDGLWYAQNGSLADCVLYSNRCLRNCKAIDIDQSAIDSNEAGWKCEEIGIQDTWVNSSNFMFDSKKIEICRLELNGDSAFQYVEEMNGQESFITSNDAFWHCENVTLKNCQIKGDRFGWYSNGLTLINCNITGSQPFANCKNLKLDGCTMENTDLAFEYSDVEATVTGNILSIINPLSGSITADSVGEVIRENSAFQSSCVIRVRKQQRIEDMYTQL